MLSFRAPLGENFYILTHITTDNASTHSHNYARLRCTYPEYFRNTHTHTHTHYTHHYMHINTQTHPYVLTDIHTHTRSHAHTLTHTHTHTHTLSVCLSVTQTSRYYNQYLNDVESSFRSLETVGNTFQIVANYNLQSLGGSAFSHLSRATQLYEHPHVLVIFLFRVFFPIQPNQSESLHHY